MVRPIRNDAAGNGTSICSHANHRGDVASVAANGVNTLLECYTANLNPLSADSELRIGSIAADGSAVYFDSVPARLYALEWSTNLAENVWNPLGTPRPGVNGPDRIDTANALPHAFFRLATQVP